MQVLKKRNSFCGLKENQNEQTLFLKVGFFDYFKNTAGEYIGCLF